ncbi:MAG: arylesterase [Sphingosinicella sp.]|nr:arylesterase [Sphingosinicella sp.]
MSLRGAYGVLAGFVHAGILAALAASAAPAVAKDLHILALGDSLTAGYGLPKGQGFAPQLEDSLRRNGIRAFVTDAGVSGDTAAAGRARLAWTLDGMKRKPDLAIVALGGNDMLRGLQPAQTRADMDAILAEFRRREIKVVVAGMLAAPNLGPVYGTEFNSIFPDLSRKYGATLYPFFLTGVAGDRRVSLPDGLHPNFQGVKKMVRAILPVVTGALRP